MTPQWIDDSSFTMGDTIFQVSVDVAVPTLPGHLRVLKERFLTEDLLDILNRVQPQRILELGIYQGGSTAMIALACDAEKVLAVDLRPSCPPLDDWRATHAHYADIVQPVYEIDQADGPTLEALLDEHFGAAELDLVVDDASHFLAETRASFNVVFPRVRPGGVYVIEDWSFVHEFEHKIVTGEIEVSAEMIAAANADPDRQQAMSRLILEIVLASAQGAIIDEVRVKPHWVEVVRGPDKTPKDFDIREYLLSSARAVLSAP